MTTSLRDWLVGNNSGQSLNHFWTAILFRPISIRKESNQGQYNWSNNFVSGCEMTEMENFTILLLMPSWSDNALLFSDLIEAETSFSVTGDITKLLTISLPKQISVSLKLEAKICLCEKNNHQKSRDWCSIRLIFCQCKIHWKQKKSFCSFCHSF